MSDRATIRQSLRELTDERWRLETELAAARGARDRAQVAMLEGLLRDLNGEIAKLNQAS